MSAFDRAGTSDGLPGVDNRYGAYRQADGDLVIHDYEGTEETWIQSSLYFPIGGDADE